MLAHRITDGGYVLCGSLIDFAKSDHSAVIVCQSAHYSQGLMKINMVSNTELKACSFSLCLHHKLCFRESDFMRKDSIATTFYRQQEEKWSDAWEGNWQEEGTGQEKWLQTVQNCRNTDSNSRHDEVELLNSLTSNSVNDMSSSCCFISLNTGIIKYRHNVHNSCWFLITNQISKRKNTRFRQISKI